MFPNQDPINRHVFWTDPVLKTTRGTTGPPQRIIGVAADIDDVHVVPEPTVTIYHTFEQGPLFRGRLFIHTSVNPYFTRYAGHANYSRHVGGPTN